MPAELSVAALLFGLLHVLLAAPDCLQLRKRGELGLLQYECLTRLGALLTQSSGAAELCALLEDGKLCSQLSRLDICREVAENIVGYDSRMLSAAVDLAVECPSSCLPNVVSKARGLRLCNPMEVEMLPTDDGVEFVHLKSPPAMVNFFIEETDPPPRIITTRATSSAPMTTATTVVTMTSSAPIKTASKSPHTSSKSGGVSMIGVAVGVCGFLFILGTAMVVVGRAIRQRRIRQMQKKRAKEQDVEADMDMSVIPEAIRQNADLVSGGVTGPVQVVAYVTVSEKSDHAIPTEDVDRLDHLEFVPPPASFDELQEELLSGQFRTTELLRESIYLGDQKLKAYTGSMLHLAGIPLNSHLCRASYEGSDFDVKALTADATEDEKFAFLQEAWIYTRLSHPNVVQLVGIVTVDDPFLMLLEPMANNTLSLYLQEHGTRLPSRLHPAFPPGTSSLFAIAHDIASAMAYLESKSFIHGALTSSSTFVMYNGVCKVSNFGASLKHYNRKEYDPPFKLVDLAVRWSAPEVLEHSEFSSASDVWSYGIILYELWTSGAKPYEYWSNIKVSEQVKNGHRLSAPNGCPTSVHHVMLKCWHMDPTTRPSFHQLLSVLPCIATDAAEAISHR